MELADIKQVGVVGSGTMGFGIAINFALAGYPTVMSDISDEILKQSMKNIKSALALFIEYEIITQKQADDAVNRITTTTELNDVASNSDFIIEAIFDRSKDKREMFNKLDELSPPHAIIASNTSSLVLSDFGSDVKRQDKIVLTHYFAPPHIVPGVEVGKGPGTSDETFNLVYDLMKKVRRVPIRLYTEEPGYLINRLQAVVFKEAARLWAQGMASAEDIELGIISTFGFRMPHEGPFKHYDLAGIWKWPEDIRFPPPEPANEVDKKISEHLKEKKTWFVNPEKFDEAVEKRDREYIRRYKALYLSKED